MDLGPSPQRIENAFNSQKIFQAESLQFSCGSVAGVHQRRADDPGRKPRGGFMDEKLFDVDARDRYFRAQGLDMGRNIYEQRDRPENQDWNAEGGPGSPSGDGSEGDEDDDEDEEDDEDVDEGDGEVEGLVVVEDGNKNNNSSGSVQSSSEKNRNEKANLQNHHSSFGMEM